MKIKNSRREKKCLREQTGTRNQEIQEAAREKDEKRTEKETEQKNYMQLKLLQDISQFGYVTTQMIVVISMRILNFNEHKDAWKLIGRQNKHHSVINHCCANVTRPDHMQKINVDPEEISLCQKAGNRFFLILSNTALPLNHHH